MCHAVGSPHNFNRVEPRHAQSSSKPGQLPLVRHYTNWCDEHVRMKRSCPAGRKRSAPAERPCNPLVGAGVRLAADSHSTSSSWYRALIRGP
jgi:hypothetical protein